MSVLLRERFQETFLDALKVHLRIFSISKCTCFGDEDSLKDPQILSRTGTQTLLVDNMVVSHDILEPKLPDMRSIVC